MGLGRILVVDDEADLRKSVRLILTKAGYDAVEAEDGEKAIEAIRSGDNPLMVDTVICDLVMPKVNGMEAIAFFRSQFPGVPILVLTGHPNIDNASDLYKQGVVDYLVKPIVPEKLLEAVEKAVKQRELFKDQFAT
ncbi:response regulator [Nitrospiraceae bacterium AH_259_D15_M11_P09]|nr:response regulator [Nitrospiraceae bacterium AH_259_D15_M11_P09]